jgi:hypothetical protein
MQAQQMLLLVHIYARIYARIYASGIQALSRDLQLNEFYQPTKGRSPLSN